MKKRLAFALAITAAVLYAEQPRSVAAVQLERDRTSAKLTELRMKYIKQDPALLKLHNQIIQLHRELALSLDARRDVRELNDTLIKLDAELRELYKSGRGK